MTKHAATHDDAAGVPQNHGTGHTPLLHMRSCRYSLVNGACTMIPTQTVPQMVLQGQTTVTRAPRDKEQ